MPDAIQAKINTIAVHKLTLGWMLLFTVNSLTSAVIGALAGTNWSQASGQTKFLICAAILMSWTTAMMAFFNQSISRLKAGKDIVPDDAIKTSDTPITTTTSTTTTTA